MQMFPDEFLSGINIKADEIRMNSYAGRKYKRIFILVWNIVLFQFVGDYQFRLGTNLFSIIRIVFRVSSEISKELYWMSIPLKYNVFGGNICWDDEFLSCRVK